MNKHREAVLALIELAAHPHNDATDAMKLAQAALNAAHALAALFQIDPGHFGDDEEGK